MQLGEIEYAKAVELQRELARQRFDGEIEDTLLLLEHPPAITFGRAASRANLLASSPILNREGISLHETDRGGDITYHGPGQLVGYPIFDLRGHGRDVHQFLRNIEAALIDALSEFGLNACRYPPHTGVWIEDRKIAAIGIKVSRWVTTHGFALNVAPNMDHFDLIVPCGIRQLGVTSMESETGRSLALTDVQAAVSKSFQHTFATSADASYATSVGQPRLQ
jgi:lipoate-protein ligase B